jgi:hypothetical protein
VLGYSRVLEGTRRRWRAAGSDGVLGGHSRVLPRYRSDHWRARPLRHGRWAAHAVLSCAGAYVSGAAGSNECPAGSVRIETEAACRTAATAAGKTPSTSTSLPFVQTYPAYPRGCYFTTNSNAWFNTHAVGAGNPYYQLLCAALAATGAPLKRRRRTDARSACTGARAYRHCACTARPSRAVCVMHGRHIDARTYINR